MSDVTYSADGNWWWDGQDWQSVDGSNDAELDSAHFGTAHFDTAPIDEGLVSELVDAYQEGAFVEIGPHATEHPLGDGAVDLTEAEIAFGASAGFNAPPPETDHGRDPSPSDDR